MKIALIAPANSIHTVRWANSLANKGCEVYLISQHQTNKDEFHSDVKLYITSFRGILGYFLMVPIVKKWLKQIKPDIVNAHYASGYGTTARLVNYRPWLLSVWGSDVYDFPYKSPLHRWLVKKNLASATRIASTSYCMAEQVNKLLPINVENIFITPFGIDTKLFAPREKPIERDKIVIGTVKTMAPKYGIDLLINSFAFLYNELYKEQPEIAEKLCLRLVGGGSHLVQYQHLVRRLNIEDKVEFIGQVAHIDVPNQLSYLDIYVALSRLESESFGVAILEASAVGLPVVVANVGGLPEVVVDKKTGLVVEKENFKDAALALKKLVLSSELRNALGENGRKYVLEHYSWKHCINIMIDAYKETIKGKV